MRKERIVTTFCRWQWIHPAIAHKLLNRKFARETEDVARDSHTPRLLASAVTFIQDLSRLEVAERCLPHVSRIRHC
jgi:hypothetical protein